MHDWQDAALSNRHLHNRVGKQGRGKGGKSNGGFNVQKTLGTYEVKCPAAAKLAPEMGEGEGKEKGKELCMELYNLNELGNALVGEMVLPGALRGVVLMAASRKTMKAAEKAFEEREDDGDEQDVENGEVVSEDDGAGTRSGEASSEETGKSDEGEHESDEDKLEQQRYKQFEKNSFRNPKFWISWQGHKDQKETAEGSSNLTGTGYLVFSGNNCEKFNATLSCEVLGWNNVKLKGFKLRGHSARDFQVQWTRQRS